MKININERYDVRVIIVFILILAIYGISFGRKGGGTSHGIKRSLCQQLDVAKPHLVSVDCDSIMIDPASNNKRPDMVVFFFEPISINFASYTLLQTVKGVGPKLAQEIIDYREKFGPFSDLDSIKKLTGVGERRAQYLITKFTFD